MSSELVAQIEANALAAAAQVPRPNPRTAAIYTEKMLLLSLVEDFKSGRKWMSPRARVEAQRIFAIAERMRRREPH
jgi:hypothetical protein